MGIFDKRREQLGIKTAEPAKKTSSGGTGGGSAFDRRRTSIQKEKEERRQQSARQTEERVERSTPSPLPSVESQLRTATTAFTPQSVNRDLRPVFGPTAPSGRQLRLAENAQQPGRDIPVIGDVLKVFDAVEATTRPGAKVAEQLYTPGAGLTAITGATAATGSLISRAAPKLGLGTGLLPTVGREAIKEGVVSAPLAAGQSLASNPRGGLEEAGKQALIGAGLGAAGGAALSGLGRGAGMVAENAAERVIGNQLGAARSIQQAGDAVTTGRLKVGGPDTYVNRVMSEISPIVTERITPPLENPNELAKWLKPHLGDVSLNEIRKLPYEDMRQLANDIKGNMNMYDVARSVAKERGYNLDDILGGNTPNFKNEVERLRMGRVAGAIDAPQNTRMALSTNAPEAPAAASQPQNSWFSQLFGDKGIGITPFGSNKSNRIVTTEQQIVNNPLRNNVSGAIEGTKQAARSTYHNTVDYLSPLNKISRKTYDAAMDSARANNVANTIIRDKFVDLEGNVIGGSLDDIMKKTRGLGKNVDDYLVLRHAITRMERGERVYDDALKMTPDKAREAVQKLEARYPALKEIGQEWDTFNTNLLDSGVREGLISEAARNAMRQANPNYASMRRQFTVGEKLAQPKFGGGSGFSGQSAPIKEVSPTGSTRRIVTPLRSAIEQTYAWKSAELRNRSMQEIVKAIQADPDGMKGIVEIVKKPTTSYKNLDDALRDGGSEEFLELLDNDFKSLFKKNSAGDENIVRAMVKGQPVFVKVHDAEAVKALLGMGADQANIVMAGMRLFSDATKRGATGLLAPMFAVKSLTADSVQAAIQSPNGFKHLAVDLPHAMISSLADALKIPGLRNLAEDFRRSGGEYSALLRGDRKLNTTISDLRRDPFLSPQGIVKGAAKTIKAPFKVLEKAADLSENANRMAAFRRAMKGKERTPENVRNAINAARESTVNFSRRGDWSNNIEAFIPYSNAAVQGIRRVGQSFIKHPVKTTGGLLSLVIAPKLYEYARFNDDPDYQKLPARERYRNIIISKNADGTFNKQFMPPEYLAFGSFLTDVLNDVINKDPEAYKGTLSSLVNAFTPPAVSGLLQGPTQGGGLKQSITGGFNATVAAPFFAVGANQSFTGAPIVPQRLTGRSPGQQFDERTSDPAKWLGEKLKISPIQVDYLIRAYGGDPARLILPLMSDVGGGTTRNTLLKNFIVDPVFTNTLSDDFYTAKESLINARTDNVDVGKKLPDWYNDEVYKLATSRAKGSASKRLSELNDSKRNITGDTTISAEEKAQKLRDVQAQINEIYLDVNSKLREAGVPMPRR
ncbi:LPD38 domain-containing protein [Paenibacillus harenae]|uniref:LPD38 domain-containing protein n=1 Tax=Paenibacillus harenae TaxID=306543 RepID=UPI0004019824|nr:LPD38 domain-containing protein [Paenibacillus harenae]